MKKVLFGTTAIAAFSIAAIADAAVVKLGLGGNYKAGVQVGQYVTGKEAENVTQDFHIINDGEIHFKAKGALDNGITIEARVELEAASVGDQIDEQWLKISSSFGSVLIGGNDSAANSLGYVGFDSVPAGVNAWDSSYGAVPAQIATFADSDTPSIQYFSPNIAGFEIGVSFSQTSPDLDDTEDTDSDNDNDDNLFTVGATYSNSFGDVDVVIGGGYATANEDFGFDSAWGIGAELGFSGFGVSGRYENVEVEGGDDEIDRYGFGVNYATGPWLFAAGYATESDDDSDTDQTVISGGAQYELGDGVTLGAAVAYGEVDENGAEEIDGFGGTLLLGVNF